MAQRKMTDERLLIATLQKAIALTKVVSLTYPTARSLTEMTDLEVVNFLYQGLGIEIRDAADRARDRALHVGEDAPLPNCA